MRDRDRFERVGCGVLARLACASAAAVIMLWVAMPAVALADLPAAQTDPNPGILAAYAPPQPPGSWEAQMYGAVTSGGLNTTYYFQ